MTDEQEQRLKADRRDAKRSSGSLPDQYPPENNQSANKRVGEVGTDLNLTEAQRSKLHRSITGDQRLTYHQIKAEAERILKEEEEG